MLPSISSFDGTAVNGATAYIVVVPADASADYSAEIALASRTNDVPRYESRSNAARRIPFVVARGPGAPGSLEQWVQDTHTLFSPFRGLRTLGAIWNGLTLQVPAAITTFGPKSLGVMAGEFLIPDPVWREATVNTDAASPLTAGGNVPALPILTLTSALTTITSSSVASPTVITTATAHGLVTGERVSIAGHSGSTPAIAGEYVATVTDATHFTISVNATVGGTGGTVHRIIRRATQTVTDRTGRGLDSYPVRLTLDSRNAGATAAADYVVFVNGQSVPFFVQNPDASATTIDLRVSTPPAGSCLVDVFFGAAVANPLTANVYDDGGMDLAHASFSNTTWVWRTSTGTLMGKLVYSMVAVSRQARVTGAWSLAKLAPVLSGVSYGYVPGGNAQFAVGPSAGGLQNDADGLILTCQVEADTSNALRGISAVLDGGAVSAGLLVEYRRADDLLWRAAGNGFASGGWDIDGAVQVRIYVRPAATDATGSITVSAYASDPPPRLLLDSTKVPLISAPAYTAARVINGSLTNGSTGDQIVFTDLYMDDVALTIDCLQRTIRAASGPLYGQIMPTNPNGWFPLPPGGTSWTNPAGFTVSLDWQNRFVI
jgi:hypothetical protein